MAHTSDWIRYHESLFKAMREDLRCLLCPPNRGENRRRHHGRFGATKPRYKNIQRATIRKASPLATSIQNQTAANFLNVLADEAEQNKAQYLPSLVQGVDHFVHSVFSTVEQGVGLHEGLLKFIGDNVRTALNNADIHFEGEINTNADADYEKAVAAVRAEAARLSPTA